MSLSILSLFCVLSLLFAFSLARSDKIYDDNDFLSNWQGYLNPVIGNSTILDLSFPGTHDTLTYDLSTVVSQGAWDDHDDISLLLHAIFELTDKIPATQELGEWIRTQAQTHTLNITSQLNNGIRFLDFRNMYSSFDLTHFDWYGLHFLQTNQVALNYLSSIKQWVIAHPSEIIIIWISKHGSTDNVGQDAYPNVTIQEKQSWWTDIQSLFGDLLINAQDYPINTTSINQYLKVNQRVLILASDHMELTNNSPLALDAAKHLDNELAPYGNIQTGINQLIQDFQNDFPQRIKNNKANSVFTLLGMAGSPGKEQGIESFFLKFLPLTPVIDDKACATSFNIPNMTAFCPLSLIECGYINNYYSQIVFEHAVNLNVMPNAIYLDGFQSDGTIQISSDPNAKYGYVDSLLLINVNRICKGSNVNSQVSQVCSDFVNQLQQRRAQFPITLFSDDQGHQINWPPVGLSTKSSTI